MKNVAIVYGGYSSEWEISKLSAGTVLKYLDRTKYTPYMINISKHGWKVEVDGVEVEMDKNDFSIPGKERVQMDVVYNSIHGSPGEDGKLLGFLETLKIPYTGSGFYASSLTFHKFWCNQLLKRFNISSADAFTFQRGDDVTALKTGLSYPCFVKPNDSGSSFGITKVSAEEELNAALEHALSESELVIIESFLDGTEVSCGVINCTGKVIALPPTEIVSENEFFDYEAKYNGESEEITPARISDEETKAIQDASIRVFNLLHLRGLARIDFIITDQGPQLIEVNCVPGLTEESIIPRQCATMGLSLSDLVNGMIAQALS